MKLLVDEDEFLDYMLNENAPAYEKLKVQWIEEKATFIDISKKTFINCTFKNCKFNLSSFRDCIFNKCKFIDCDFAHTNFSCSVFSFVKFKKCSFDYSNFYKAQFYECKTVDCPAPNYMGAMNLIEYKDGVPRNNSSTDYCDGYLFK